MFPNYSTIDTFLQNNITFSLDLNKGNIIHHSLFIVHHTACFYLPYKLICLKTDFSRFFRENDEFKRKGEGKGLINGKKRYFSTISYIINLLVIDLYFLIFLIID